MVKKRISEKPTWDDWKSQERPKAVQMKLKTSSRRPNSNDGSESADQIGSRRPNSNDDSESADQVGTEKKRSVESKSVGIAGSKDRARVGSYVRFRKGPVPGIETSVAKILKVERTSARGVSTVHVRWFYRPEDTRCGRRPYHGRMELLLSDHVTIESSTFTVELCRVFTIDSYISKRLTSADRCSYYWRFHYEIATGNCVRFPAYCLKCGSTLAFQLVTVQGQES